MQQQQFTPAEDLGPIKKNNKMFTGTLDCCTVASQLSNVI